MQNRQLRPQRKPKQQGHQVSIGVEAHWAWQSAPSRALPRSILGVLCERLAHTAAVPQDALHPAKSGFEARQHLPDPLAICELCRGHGHGTWQSLGVCCEVAFDPREPVQCGLQLAQQAGPSPRWRTLIEVLVLSLPWQGLVPMQRIDRV